jgi:hypothetical protein
MTDTVASQNIDPSSWDTQYVLDAFNMFKLAFI